MRTGHDALLESDGILSRVNRQALPNCRTMEAVWGTVGSKLLVGFMSDYTVTVEDHNSSSARKKQHSDLHSLQTQKDSGNVSIH